MIEKPKWHDDPPSEHQLAYARENSISISNDVTKGELSRLIGLHKYGDAHWSYHKAARYFGLGDTKGTDKYRLLSMLQTELAKPERSKQLAEWYVFRVYRHLTGHARGVNADTPGHRSLSGVVDLLTSSERAMKSLTKEAQHCTYLYFGPSPDGSTGSSGTIAYRSVNKAVRAVIAAENEAKRQSISTTNREHIAIRNRPPVEQAPRVIPAAWTQGQSHTKSSSRNQPSARPLTKRDLLAIAAACLAVIILLIASN